MTQLSHVSTRTRRWKGALRTFLFVTLAACAYAAGAQTPGTDDPAWQTPTLPPRPYGFTGWYDTDTQPNGKLVVVGRLEGENFLWRYADNGTFDASFGADGAASLPIPATSVTVDGFGRIYAWSAQTRQIIRLLPGGTVDSSFGTGGMVTIEGAATGYLQLTPLSDGNLLLTEWNYVNSPLLLRKLLPDGRVDSSFGTNGELALGVVLSMSLAATHDGGFVIGVSENSGTSNAVARIWKYSPNGTRDSSFGTNGEISAAGISDVGIEPLAEGQLLVILERSSGAAQYFLARLTPTGRLDTTFGNNGYVAMSNNFNMAVEPGGGIVISRVGSLSRLTPKGMLDSSFGGTPATGFVDLEIGDGIYGLTSTIEPDINRSHTIRKFVAAPPLRSGSRSTGAASSSTFRIVAEDLRGVTVSSTSIANAVGIHAYIYPQTSDLNVTGDLFVVVSTSRGMFMRNAAGVFVPWNGQVATLVPAYGNAQLTSALHVPVYSGQLPFTDTYRIYVGYRRSEGGPLIYIDAPTTLTVN